MSYHQCLQEADNIARAAAILTKEENKMEPKIGTVNMIEYYALIDDAKELMEKAGLSYRELGVILGIDHSLIYKVLNGKLKTPNYRIPLRIFKYFERPDLVFDFLAVMEG